MYQLLYKVSDLDQWKTEQTYSDISKALDNARDWLEDGYIVQINEIEE